MGDHDFACDLSYVEIATNNRCVYGGLKSMMPKIGNVLLQNVPTDETEDNLDSFIHGRDFHSPVMATFISFL